MGFNSAFKGLMMGEKIYIAGQMYNFEATTFQQPDIIVDILPLPE